MPQTQALPPTIDENPGSLGSPIRPSCDAIIPLPITAKPNYLWGLAAGDSPQKLWSGPDYYGLIETDRVQNVPGFIHYVNAMMTDDVARIYRFGRQ